MTAIAAEWMPHFNRLDSDVQAVKAGERVCRRDIGERLDVIRAAQVDAVEHFDVLFREMKNRQAVAEKKLCCIEETLAEILAAVKKGK